METWVLVDERCPRCFGPAEAREQDTDEGVEIRLRCTVCEHKWTEEGDDT